MWSARFINEITAPGHRWKAFLPSASVMTEPRARAVPSPAVLFARKWLGTRNGRSPATAEALR